LSSPPLTSAIDGERATKAGPLVSAVIPTHDRPHLVVRAVQSVLNQTYDNLEIIVVMDGPDPDSVATLEGLHAANLRIIALENNVGVAEVRNIGIRAAKGEWVALLDDDDEWLPGKVAREVEAIDNPDVNFVACRHREADTGFERSLPARLPNKDENWSEYICCSNNLFLPSSWMIRSDFMQSFPFESGVNLCEDIFWLLHVRASNSIVPRFLEDVLVIFHNDHGGVIRLSRSRTWEVIHRWAVTNQKALLTPRAFAYFLVRFCFPRARRSGTPWKDSLMVLYTAASIGSPDMRLAAIAVANAFLSAGLRRKLRKGYEAAAGFMRQPVNGAPLHGS
jgi:glycosyltransferase involved in cell wall biosynthesis